MSVAPGGGSQIFVIGLSRCVRDRIAPGEAAGSGVLGYPACRSAVLKRGPGAATARYASGQRFAAHAGLNRNHLPNAPCAAARRVHAVLADLECPRALRRDSHGSGALAGGGPLGRLRAGADLPDPSPVEPIAAPRTPPRMAARPLRGDEPAAHAARCSHVKIYRLTPRQVR